MYSEVLAYDEGPINKLKHAGFQEEMRLKEDAWHGTSYVDYVYLGLFREEWLQRRLSYIADLATLSLWAERRIEQESPSGEKETD